MVDHSDPETEQLPKTWTRGCIESRSPPKKRAAQSSLLYSAEWGEGCPGSDDRRCCKKNFRFHQLQKDEGLT